jgi:hypothetical protein
VPPLVIRFVLLALATAAPAMDAMAAPHPVQEEFSVADLADYRLTPGVFSRFVTATRLIGKAMHDDPRLAADPLFTREVAVLDDVVAAAERVNARLKFEPRYTTALRVAGLSSREYTRFALALVGARLAHGFMQSGALRRVPAGPAADNVAFVAAHEPTVREMLALLGLEDPL